MRMIKKKGTLPPIHHSKWEANLHSCVVRIKFSGEDNTF